MSYLDMVPGTAGRKEGRRLSLPDLATEVGAAELVEFIRCNRYTSIKAMARRLGCSVRQARRYVARIRALSPDPLLYDQRHRGYFFASPQGGAADAEGSPDPLDPEAAPASTGLPLPSGLESWAEDPDALDWSTLPKPPAVLAWTQVLASVGVDVGSAWIKVVQVARSRRGPVIVNLGLCPTPAGAVSSKSIHAGAVGAALRKLLRDRSIVPWQAFTVAGGDRLVTAHLDLPPVPPDELRGIMRWEAEGRLPFPFEEAIVDYLVLPDTSETGGDQSQAIRVFLAGARRQVVHAYEAALRSAGLEPRAVDIEPLATHRAIRAARGWSASPWRNAEMVVNFGWSTTSVAVFYRGSLEAYDNYAAGSETLTSALAARLRLPRVKAESLKRRHGVRPESGTILQAANAGLSEVLEGVGRTLGTYLRGQTSRPIRRIYLTGGGARLPGLPEAVAGFAERVPSGGKPTRGLKVEVADPLAMALLSPRLAGQAALVGPEFTTALGAAITGGESLHEL